MTSHRRSLLLLLLLLCAARPGPLIVIESSTLNIRPRAAPVASEQDAKRLVQVLRDVEGWEGGMNRAGLGGSGVRQRARERERENKAAAGGREYVHTK